MNRAKIHANYKAVFETPKEFFDMVNKEFNFTLDAAATPENALCRNYLTPGHNALDCSWYGRVWLNPPFGRGIGAWVEKAFKEVESERADVVVCLLPNNTDAAWFHDWVLGKAEIRFVRGRLSFCLDGIPQRGNPTGSILAIYKRRCALFDAPGPAFVCSQISVPRK